MWPFNKKHNADNKNIQVDADEIACLKIIADYLLLLPASGFWDDCELLDTLGSKGHDKLLSWYVIGLLPIIAGREIINHFEVTCTNSLQLVDDDGKLPQIIQFNDFPAYRAIMQSRQRIFAHPNIRNIMVWGAEVHCINDALNDGAELKGAVLSDVVLICPI